LLLASQSVFLALYQIVFRPYVSALHNLVGIISEGLYACGLVLLRNNIIAWRNYQEINEVCMWVIGFFISIILLNVINVFVASLQEFFKSARKRLRRD
jgi:hypothetical protein